MADNSVEYPNVEYPGGFGIHDVIGYGNSSLLVLDSRTLETVTAIKKPLDANGALHVDRERQIYERFALQGGHGGLLKYYGTVENGIRLEYAARHDLDTPDVTEQPLHVRRRWIMQIAVALRFIHGAGVIHGDLRRANILVDDKLDAKVADFAGSSLDLSPLLIESPAFNPYYTPLSTKGDIYAFGSLAYEILTGHRLDLDRGLSFSQELEGKSLGIYAMIINKCWQGAYSNCDGLIQDLNAAAPGSSPARNSVTMRMAMLGIVGLTITVLALRPLPF
ncbi:hypothetical protein NHJ13734_009913 [Beauveria thailandica]